MPTTYPSLSMRAPLRLALFKREASDPKRHWIRPMSWRDVRFATLRSQNTGLSGNGREWYGFDVSGYFRDIRDAGDIRNMRHSGWYTDIHSIELAVGIVARLSHGRFISGYRWDSNGEHVFYPEIFDDETDAARAADSHAERFAEMARDDSERYQSMTLAELDVEEKTTELQKAIALRHRAKFGGFDRVREAIETLREARETLADATAAY